MLHICFRSKLMRVQSEMADGVADELRAIMDVYEVEHCLASIADVLLNEHTSSLRVKNKKSWKSFQNTAEFLIESIAKLETFDRKTFNFNKQLKYSLNFFGQSSDKVFFKYYYTFLSINDC